MSSIIIPANDKGDIFASTSLKFERLVSQTICNNYSNTFVVIYDLYNQLLTFINSLSRKQFARVEKYEDKLSRNLCRDRHVL